jgi:hypothetical protein
MPIPARFDFETLSPVEVDLLLVLSFLPNALILAFALPLNQGKQDQVDVHPETYRPRILCSQFLFLSPRILPRDFSIAVLAELDEGNGVHLYKVRIGPMCTYEYTHSLVTTNWRQGTIPPSGESV